MDFSYLQSRVSTPSIPPHRTQLHPRMRSTTPKLTTNTTRNKLLIVLAFLFTVPSLYYLFATARRLHQSSKFTHSSLHFYGIVIDAGLANPRLRVFKSIGDGRTPFIDLITARADLDLDVAIEGLIKAAKHKVPTKEWPSTRVQLMLNGAAVREKVLDKCRRVLRASGFAFKDEWAHVIQGQEKGIYTWIATNYALGTLGGEPNRTIGTVELGGSSLQVTLARRESTPTESSRTIRFAGVTYNLYTQSLPQFGQDAAWESLHELQNSTDSTSFSSSSKGIVNTPCIPKGYELTSNASDRKLLIPHAAGNFSACRFEVLTLLKRGQDKCLRPPCQLISSFFSGLQDKTGSPENFVFTSELYGLLPRASLFEMEAFGRHYCENDWDNLKSEDRTIDDFDLLRYCFFSAYTVALLHDSLGIPMHDKRIGFVNQKGIPLDWTLGAFIFQSMLQPLQLEPESLDQIVGSESVTYFSLFALLLIALLAAIFVVQWRKPQLKTIYDLEKGHYIVTRVPS